MTFFFCSAVKKLVPVTHITHVHTNCRREHNIWDGEQQAYDAHIYRYKRKMFRKKLVNVSKYIEIVQYILSETWVFSHRGYTINYLNTKLKSNAVEMAKQNIINECI